MSAQQKSSNSKSHLKLMSIVAIVIVLATLILGLAAWKVYAAQTRELQVTIQSGNSSSTFYITSSGFGTTDPVRTLVRLSKFQPIYDQQALRSSIASLASQTDRAAKDFTLNVSGSTAALDQNRQPGFELDQNLAYQQIVDAFQHGDKSLTLQAQEIQPQINKASAQNVVAQAQNILAKTLSISYQGQSFKVPVSQIGTWISSSPSADGGSLQLNYDSAKISSDLKDLTASLSTTATPMQIDIENNTVRSFTAPIIGSEADGEAGAQTIIDLLKKRAAASSSNLPTEQPIILASKQIIPPVPDSAKQLGIIEPIGTASTLMTGSTKARISNIKVGASKLNGILIAPGQEFSTIQTLGEIDASTGYVPELSIIGNKTIPEYGGGLCQVATTLFRSALNTGLPINERQNHSYRVPYYEKDGDGNFIGPGLDATIYVPSPDLKFTNNTGNWILLASQINGLKITFTMYGTSDGRKSSVDGPHTLTTIPAPDPIYTNTDKLPAGETQKIDTAHAGGKATATYTVTYADGTVKKQVFNSSYTPWPAKYLVGTGPAAGSSVNPSQLVSQD